ncbi:MAG: peptide chain release factor N(5)-glutamine methyltransferase [Roseinatronobacter sp.]
MRASDALARAVMRLRDAGVPGAAGDARRLLAHAMDLDPARLTLHLGDTLTEAQLARFATLTAARARFQPVAQLVGGRDFWGRRFTVTPDVLDPRPETETLIAAALEKPFADVLDLGTGSGAILLTLLAERGSAQGLGVDLSPAALDVAQANAQALGITHATFLPSDWFAAVTGRFDLIVSNPPYISETELAALSRDVRDWEPRMALVPAQDDGTGLAAYRHICAQAPRHLRPGGWLIVEIGAGQGTDVAQLFVQAGFLHVRIRKDFDERDRVIEGQWQEPA